MGYFDSDKEYVWKTRDDGWGHTVKVKERNPWYTGKK